MQFLSLSICILAIIQQARAGALELTEATFESSLTGKSSLVMFKAPWCGHCKSMTPAFDEVADQINGPGSQGQLAFVDCTVQTNLCQKQGVTGYPTLKVFDSETGTSEGKPYNGGRDVASLKSFAEENLKSKCSVAQPEGCSDKEKTFIEKMKSAPKTEINEQITRLDKMKASSMAPELKKWVHQRLSILKELA